MKTIIPTSTGSAVTCGGTAADGILLEAEVEITHISEAILRGKVDNTKKKDSEYQAAKTAVMDSQKALDEAFEEALTFSQKTRDNLKSKISPRYSRGWNEVGFVNNSLMLPRSIDKTMALVGSMALFLEAHPELNVAGLMTAEIATTTHNALSGANTALNQANKDARLKREARDEALADLRKALIGLRRELSLTLSPNDPRWISFGFNVPADMTVPELPADVTVTPGLPGHAVLRWSRSVGADRYHVWKQHVGVDTDPVRVATVRELSKDIDGLVSGAHVKFYVTALNAAGESLASATVEIVVP